jgi:predicted DNA-binding transcriptional regulator AlpA
MRIVRLSEALSITGKSRSPFYDDMTKGLLPKPVPLSEQSRGWVDEELYAVNRARVAVRDLGLRGEERDAFIRAAVAAASHNGEAK